MKSNSVANPVVPTDWTRWTRRTFVVGGLAVLSFIATPVFGQAWSAAGPEVIINGQTEGIGVGGAVPNPVVGAVKAVVPVPGAADQMLLGAVNGGIWRATNLTNAAGPTWTNVTPNPTQTTHSIGAMAFTLNDPNRVYAGFGADSSFGGSGGALNGLLVSTNSGASWAPVVSNAGAGVNGVNITAVQSRGSNVIVITGRENTFDTQVSTKQGLWRSSDGGATFSQLATGTGNAAGLPIGDYTDLVNAPGNTSAMYCAVINTPLAAETGIYRSTDAGQTWAQVEESPAAAVNIRLAGRDNTFSGPSTVFAAVVTGTNGDGTMTDLIQTANDGANWKSLFNPSGPVSDGFGLQNSPDAQGQTHMSIAADPTNANVVYVGGQSQDKAGANFPNQLGANDYSGRLFRATFNPGAGTTTWDALTNQGGAGAGQTPGGGTANNTSPHADSRAIAFANGTLYEGDDAGIYQRSSPQNNTGDWSSRIGTGLQISESYQVAYDRVSGIIMTSNQDTGASQQSASGSKTYQSVPSPGGGFMTGDGGVVKVDSWSVAGKSIRYASSNNFSNLQMTTYNANGTVAAGPTTLAASIGGGQTINDLSFAKTPPPFELDRNDTTGKRMAVGAIGKVYESTDQGATFGSITPGGFGAAEGVTALVDGGRKAGVDKPQVLFVGTNAGAIWRRPDTGGALVKLTKYTGANAWDMVSDSEDWGHLWAIDNTNNTVYQSLNADAAGAAGPTFANITGNLPAGFSLETIAFIAAGAQSTLVVGGLGGVYSELVSSNGTWNLLGTGMPGVRVMDLSYEPGSNLLVAGTLGRGVWTIPVSIPEPTSIVIAVIGGVFLGFSRRPRQFADER